MTRPLLAALFSLLIPGLGQFYAGHLLRSSYIFIAFVVLASLLAVAAGSMILLLIMGLIVLAYWIWNMADAYKLASREAQESQESQEPQESQEIDLSQSPDE
jgi:TM2 domain-containing membrane protein YozV